MLQVSVLERKSLKDRLGSCINFYVFDQSVWLKDKIVFF